MNVQITFYQGLQEGKDRSGLFWRQDKDIKYLTHTEIYVSRSSIDIVLNHWDGVLNQYLDK